MNTFEEIYFPFDEAVLTSKIEFTVMDVVLGSSSIYYWKLRLFGCREVNGKFHKFMSSMSIQIPTPKLWTKSLFNYHNFLS